MLRGDRISSALIVVWASAASAQPVTPDDDATITLLLENDSITREDDNYSNGLAFSYMSGTFEPQGFAGYLANNWVFPRPKEGALARRGFSVAHLIYTPDNLRIAELQPNDHPYAGVAFADASWVIQQRKRQDTFTFEVGLVGPRAQGEQIQDFVHLITGNVDPQGWDNQIQDEVLFNVHYDLQYKITEKSYGSRDVDVIGTANLSAGNRLASIGGGTKIRWGTGLDQTFGPLRIRPAQTGSAYFTPTRGFSWHLFAGGELRAVAHNIVLDNSFFRDGGPQVSSKEFVADFELGGVVQWGKNQAALSLVARSPEFEEDEETQTIGAISLARKF